MGTETYSSDEIKERERGITTSMLSIYIHRKHNRSIILFIHRIIYSKLSVMTFGLIHIDHLEEENVLINFLLREEMSLV